MQPTWSSDPGFVMTQASTFQLIGELVDEVRTLLRQEVALARAELREEAVRLMAVVALGTIAAGTLAIAGLWLLIAITRALASVFALSLAIVYAGVGIVLGIVGLVMMAIVWRQVASLRVLPRTRQTLRDRPWAPRREGRPA
jgi:hypothetical protein